MVGRLLQSPVFLLWPNADLIRQEQREVQNGGDLADALGVGLPTDAELIANGFEIMTTEENNKMDENSSGKGASAGEDQTRGLPQPSVGQESGVNSPSTQDPHNGHLGSLEPSTSNQGASSSSPEQVTASATSDTLLSWLAVSLTALINPGDKRG
jgi:hypothetical protein